MKVLRTLALTALGLSLSACAAVELPSRNAPYEPLPAGAVSAPDGYEFPQELDAGSITPVVADGALEPAPQPLHAGQLNIARIDVRVPRSLKVSEANSYLPASDIVWREDPLGDRHAQVQTIVQNALEQGTAGYDGAVPVALDIEITRFHALTEKARYTVGGVHSIKFTLALKDPQTGVLLSQPRHVDADLRAYGGARALAAMAHGETQKVRITAHLAQVIQDEIAAETRTMLLAQN